MNPLKNLLEVIKNDRTFIVGLLDIFFLMLPGVALIYFYQPDLFFKLDWVKLSILSMTITTPVALVNAFCATSLLSKENNSSPEALFAELSFGIWCTGILLYMMIPLTYFFNRPLHQNLIFVALVEVAVLIFASFKDRQARLKK